MPDIQAFHGVRYDLGHIGALSNVVAPPYDVINDDYRDELYKRHPANAIRLILNRDEPGDGPDDKYNRAAQFLKNWRDEGVMFDEGEPAIYVYHQQFDYAGRTYIRRGFMCRVRLERFGEGKIYPHEITMSGPKADRLKLTKACQANLSQIFGLYPDPENVAQNVLESSVAGQEPVVATDDLGVIHSIWPVVNTEVITQVSTIMGPKPVFIADGHHRYETACNYRDEVAAAAGGELPSGHPANYVLMYCNGMSDQGLIVLPTHRLFRDAPKLSSTELIERLGDCFTSEIAGEGKEQAKEVWQKIESEGDQGTIGLFAATDSKWLLARITEKGKARFSDIAADVSDDWRQLGVSILHRLIFEELLGVKNPEKPSYVHLINEVIEGLSTGGFPLAALVMPASLDHIRVISERKERMPAKSTYFFPKLLSGLVINPLV